MQKASQALSKSFGHVKVYFTDIQELIDVIKLFSKKPDREFPDKDKLTISINGYILESEDEISKFRDQTINEFAINYKSQFSVYFSLQITKKGIYIYCDNDDPYNLGVFNKVTELSNSYRRKFQWSEYLIYISSPFIIGPILVLNSEKGSTLYFIGTIISYVIIVTFIVYLVGIPYRKTIINLTRQNKSFWAKNKDQMIIGIIGAVIGGIITIVTTIILFKMGILK